MGKHQVGEFTPFDPVLLLFISEGASNALRADDNSITGAFLVIAVMLAITWALGKLGIFSTGSS